MNDQQVQHAIRYATEMGKVFLMNEYKHQYPHYFQNAILKTRPATHDDYFVPPSIADQCIVVEETRLDEKGCKRFGCFPFKEKWQSCNENDPTQWINIGNTFVLSCQKSCRDHAIDTEWSTTVGGDGRCFVSNPLKKTLASMPEKLFERASRHVFHGGLDIVDGHLKLNETYCHAYGLSFVNDDCVSLEFQQIAEYFFGKTPIRAIKTAGVKTYQPPPAPPLPDFMNYSVRKRRMVGGLSSSSDDDNPVFREIAIDLTKDLGREVSEWAVKSFLKNKAPKLLSKAIENVAVKLALKNSVLVSMKSMGSSILRSMGSAVGIGLSIYALYEQVVWVLDTLDPFDYFKVLDKQTLISVDRQLDYNYYPDGPLRPELTPEFIWEHEILSLEDDNYLNFMAEKIEEYMTAMYAIPPDEYHRLFDTQRRQKTTLLFNKEKDWSDSLFKCVIFIIICLTILFIDWIHVWACCLFFAMLSYNAY